MFVRFKSHNFIIFMLSCCCWQTKHIFHFQLTTIFLLNDDLNATTVPIRFSFRVLFFYSNLFSAVQHFSFCSTHIFINQPDGCSPAKASNINANHRLQFPHTQSSKWIERNYCPEISCNEYSIASYKASGRLKNILVSQCIIHDPINT